MPEIKPLRIAVLGAGFGGVTTFKKLHHLFHRNKNVELILVNRNNYFLFTPLLHEVATGGISADHIIEPLRKALGCCMNSFYMGDVTRVAIKQKRIETTVGSFSYDYCVCALGAETNYYAIPGAQGNTFPLKSLGDATILKNHCIDLFERASKVHDEETLNRMLRFVIVGGGATGVELAAEMQEFFCDTFGKFYKEHHLISHFQIVLLQKMDEILPQFPSDIRKKTVRILEKKGISIRTKTSVVEVRSDHVTLDTGEHIPTETTVWVAGIKPCDVQFDKAVKKDSSGRLLVNECLQLVDHPSLFALGDLAMFTDVKSARPLPALAQVATQEAYAVAQNIERLIAGKPCEPFVYKHKGDLLSLGQWMALAEIGPFHMVGHLAWWLWRTVYLFKLISWQKKIKVALDWTINLFSPRDISQL